MKKLALIVFLLVLSALAALSAQDRITLRILVPQSVSSLPIYLLADRDPLPGIDLRCEGFINHPQALALIIRGEADLLLTGTSQGWENFLGGGPLVLIDTGIWGISSLIGAPGSAPIHSLSELAGKRVAFPFPGSPLDFQTRAILAKHGLDSAKSLKIVYLTFGQSVPMLLMGQLDAAPVPEPLATELEQNRGLPRLLDYAQAWAEVSGGDPRSPQVSLFATRAWLARNSRLVPGLIEHWRRASQDVAAEPADVARRYAEALGASPMAVEKAIPHTLFWVPEPEENRRRVMEYYGQVKEYLPGERGELGQEFFFEGRVP